MLTIYTASSKLTARVQHLQLAVVAIVVAVMHGLRCAGLLQLVQPAFNSTNCHCMASSTMLALKALKIKNQLTDLMYDTAHPLSSLCCFCKQYIVPPLLILNSMCQLQLHDSMFPFALHSEKLKSVLISNGRCVTSAAHSSSQLHRCLLSDSSPADQTEPDTAVTHPQPDISCGTHRVDLMG